MALHDSVIQDQNARLRELVHSPAFVVVAGSLPGLYVATSLENGAAIGVVSAVSILAMAILARPLRAVTGKFSRIPVMLMVSAAVVAICGFALRVYDPLVNENVGMYVSIAAVNALAMAFATDEDYAAAPTSGSSLGTAVFGAVCTVATLAFVGLVNGMFSTGEIFGLTMTELAASPIAIFGTPAGSLLVLALVAAFINSVVDAAKKSAASQGGEQ